MSTRDRQVVDLAAQGLDFGTIAEQLGFEHAEAARDAWRRANDEKLKTHAFGRDERVEMQQVLLDKAKARLSLDLAGSKTVRDRSVAVGALLAVMDHEAKLRDLYAPTRSVDELKVASLSVFLHGALPKIQGAVPPELLDDGVIPTLLEGAGARANGHANGNGQHPADDSPEDAAEPGDRDDDGSPAH